MAGYDASFDILPACGLLDLRGRNPVRQRCSDALELELPDKANRLVCGSQDRIGYCISDGHWILRIDEGQQSDVLQTLEKAAAGLSHSFVDVSDMYCRIRLTGSEAREVLAQGVGIDIHPRVFPAGSTARTALARITAQLHCVDDRPTYIVNVYSSYQRYISDWLCVAIGRG